MKLKKKKRKSSYFYDIVLKAISCICMLFQFGGRMQIILFTFYF